MLYTFFTYVKNSLWSRTMRGTGRFAHMASLKCSVFKVFRTYFTYSFFRKFWYHVVYLGHKLWLEQARSCKWLAFDMMLYTFLTYVKNSLWSHTMPRIGTFAHMASLKCSTLKVFRTCLIYSFFWKLWYHGICLCHKLWLEQARSCKWLLFDMMFLFSLC